MPPLELAYAVTELAREYNTALLAVERNNHGRACWLISRGLSYERLHERADRKDG